MGSMGTGVIEETSGDETKDKNEFACEDGKDADPEPCCEQNIKDDSVAESVDEFDFQD